MTDFLICIEDAKHSRYGRVGFQGGALARVDSSSSFAGELDAAVAAANASPFVRVRADSPDGIGLDARRVATDDPRLLDALASSFRSRGCDVRLYDRRRADAWRLLRAVPVAADLREAFSSSLDAMPEDALEELIAMLESGARALAHADAKAAGRLASLDAEDAAALSGE